MAGLELLTPDVWSTKLLMNLNKNLVYGAVVNRDYEGEITGFGNSVKINNIGRVTVASYTKNTNINAAEDLTAEQRTLLIDQQKYFNFQIDDIDKAQNNPKVMDAAMMEAGYALADTADIYIASKYADVLAANEIGDDTTPVVPTATDAYDYIVDIVTKMDEANVPKINRWIVIPAWYKGMLLKDKRFTDLSASGMETLKTGEIANIAGCRIFESNNVPNTTGTKYKIMGGYMGTISFADQIVSMEAYRMELRFSDAIKGLHVYGAKTVRPDTLVVMTANKA